MHIKQLVLGLLHTNCYILYDEKSKDAVIVDPATNYKKIKESIDELGVKVNYIILTHAHSDHICALDELCDATGAKVCIGEKDAAALNDAELNLCNYFRKPSPIHTPDIILRDNDIIESDGFTLSVISTPGHTVGSISLYCQNTLVAGDTLFFESVGRTDFATSCTSDLIMSIKNKIFTLDRDTVVYPGHGEATTVGHEIDNNPFVW